MGIRNAKLGLGVPRFLFFHKTQALIIQSICEFRKLLKAKKKRRNKIPPLKNSYDAIPL